jgi:hypothetical protein
MCRTPIEPEKKDVLDVWQFLREIDTVSRNAVVAGVRWYIPQKCSFDNLTTGAETAYQGLLKQIADEPGRIINDLITWRVTADDCVSDIDDGLILGELDDMQKKIEDVEFMLSVTANDKAVHEKVLMLDTVQRQLSDTLRRLLIIVYGRATECKAPMHAIINKQKICIDTMWGMLPQELIERCLNRYRDTIRKTDTLTMSFTPGNNDAIFLTLRVNPMVAFPTLVEHIKIAKTIWVAEERRVLALFQKKRAKNARLVV